MFIDTGIRASELVGLTLDDVDLGQQMALVMGKGGRGRAVPFGIRTTDALRRYLKSRRQHPLAASTQAFWLGRKGPLTVSGVAQLLERRGADAGVDHLHPHRFRHTMAHRWLSAGGQEQDLDEARRLAHQGDGRPICGKCCRQQGTGGAQTYGIGGPAVSEPSDPPWVDPATVPELAEILRRKWLSKVRIYDGWCENGDRLLQVITVQGRPLALARAAALASTGSPNPAYRRSAHLDHRSYWQAAWLDLSWDAYFLPHDPPEPGQSVTLRPYVLSVQCQHERLAVPLKWLRGQVNTGVSKRVITSAVRFEMGTSPRRR